MIRKLSILFLAVMLGCTPVADITKPEEDPTPEKEDPKQEPELDSNTNVYGFVTCDGEGVANVVVSDGYKVVKTDKDGMYQMASSKKLGYVFISIPSGYVVSSDGVIPQFFKYTDKYTRLQQLDFELIKDSDQNEYEMLIIGDIQLARRSNDIGQFAHFTNELKSYLSANSGKKIFALTLGDMTWDSHWISGSYGLADYLNDINKVKNLQIFHAIGNHDHELEAAGDYLCGAKYREIIGPSYYSFNIGRYHYVILDNIECTNDGSGEKATYNDLLVEEQISWLKLDLEQIGPTTPVICVMHAPLYTESGNRSLDNADDVLACFNGLKMVYILSGHTHIIYNIDKTSQSTPLMELNSGAICATWWYTGYDHPWLHIGRDGSPGGYRVWDVKGKDVTWYFKGIEQPENYQFRSYDRNEICIDVDRDAPDANSDYKTKLAESLGEYGTENKENYIYLNVWDWDPSWKIEVTEDGKSLEVKRFKGTDPLHVLAYNVTRANMNKSLSFPARETQHLFKAKASSATSTVEIRITDRFGRVYTESMKRPKEFSVEAYMKTE